MKNEANGKGWIVGFNGHADNLKDFTTYFEFMNNCPLLPASIRVKVNATAVAGNSQPAFVQTGEIKNNHVWHCAHSLNIGIRRILRL